jgi:hypothetical protein
MNTAAPKRASSEKHRLAVEQSFPSFLDEDLDSGNDSALLGKIAANNRRLVAPDRFAGLYVDVDRAHGRHRVASQCAYDALSPRC